MYKGNKHFELIDIKISTAKRAWRGFAILHFHFLLHILSEDAILKHSPDVKHLPPSRIFSNFFNAYARAFNNRYGRFGSLFNRPFGRKRVAKTAVLDWFGGAAEFADAHRVMVDVLGEDFVAAWGRRP